jgi:hypothetical protein
MKKTAKIKKRVCPKEFSKWHQETWEACGLREPGWQKTELEQTGILLGITFSQACKILQIATGDQILVDLNNQTSIALRSKDLQDRRNIPLPVMQKVDGGIAYFSPNRRKIFIYSNGHPESFCLDCSHWWGENDNLKSEIITAVSQALSNHTCR